MGRLLGLLLLAGLAWLVVRHLLGSAGPRRTGHDAPPRFEKTVQCARCGVHLPLSLARRDDDDRPVCADPECERRE